MSRARLFLATVAIAVACAMRRLAIHAESARTGQPTLRLAAKLSTAMLVCVLAGTLTTVPERALASGDANRTSCPNEATMGFRTGLPDCRAYEQVTPPFKYGQNELRQGFFVGESHLSFSSLGGFAEAENDESAAGSSYIVSRAAGGWATSAVDLPASQFEKGFGFPRAEALLDVSGDFSKTLSTQVPAGAKNIDSRFYLREAANGASCPSGARPVGSAGCAVEVGRTLPAAAVASANSGDVPKLDYQGASENLGHLVYGLEAYTTGSNVAWRWPGDTTVSGQALYELTGTNQLEPKLVAVSNEHQLARNTEAAMIGQCGSVLGGQPETGADAAPEKTAHAISVDGTHVYFTVLHGGCPSEAPGSEQTGEGPPVNELYLRLDGSRTLAISEPPLSTPGRECTGLCAEDQTVGAKRSEGVFAGANEDGSKVYFLTRQPLVNSDESAAGSGQDLYEAEVEGSGSSAKLGKLLQLSHDPVAGEAADVAGVVAVSPAGSRVYYVAQGVLASNADAKGETAQSGADNLYLAEPDPAHPGAFRNVFIATLSPEDSPAWGFLARNNESTPATGTTVDGQFLLFRSVNDLTPDAHGTVSQLYRFDSATTQLVRVSTGACPEQPAPCAPAQRLNDNEPNTYFNGAERNFGGSTSYAGPQPVTISNDGQYVFFESPTALTPTALEKRVVGCEEPEKAGECESPIYAQNVYEWHEGNIYLISDGQDHNVIFEHSTTKVIGASPSGQDVYLTSGDPLVPSDTDTQEDIYDARIEGGIPTVSAGAGCQGEACRGATPPAPGLSNPASETFIGPGNPPPPASSNVQAKGKGPSRATLLARALRACRRKPHRHRKACERAARRRYSHASRTLPAATRRNK